MIALLAAAMQGGIYGNVDVETGLILVGPAMLGVIMRHRDPAAHPGEGSLAPVRHPADRRRHRNDRGLMDLVLAGLLCAIGGVVAGLIGVGGGIVFVPAMTVLLSKGQVEARSTSLLMIALVSVIRTWRQKNSATSTSGTPS